MHLEGRTRSTTFTNSELSIVRDERDGVQFQQMRRGGMRQVLFVKFQHVRGVNDRVLLLGTNQGMRAVCT